MHSHQFNSLKQENVFPRSLPMCEGPTQPTSQPPPTKRTGKMEPETEVKCSEVNHKTKKSLQTVWQTVKELENHKNHQVLKAN